MRLNILLIIGLTLPFFTNGQKNKKLEDEKIALQFFLDSIYPFRPLIKDKQLVSEGKIVEESYRSFFYVIPFYRDIIKLAKLEEAGIIKTHSKERNGVRIYQIKGSFSLCKYNIKKRKYNYFSNKFDSSLVYLEMSSMYYDSTKQEKLININAFRTNLRNETQQYIYFSYAMVVKNKKIIHWAIRETY